MKRVLMEKLKNVCETKNVLLEHLYHKPLLDPEEIFVRLMKWKEMIAPYRMRYIRLSA